MQVKAKLNTKGGNEILLDITIARSENDEYVAYIIYPKFYLKDEALIIDEEAVYRFYAIAPTIDEAVEMLLAKIGLHNYRD